MATVDSDKVVCGGIHAKIVAVLVSSEAIMMLWSPIELTNNDHTG
jgi:hypothetical protein